MVKIVTIIILLMMNMRVFADEYLDERKYVFSVVEGLVSIDAETGIIATDIPIRIHRPLKVCEFKKWVLLTHNNNHRYNVVRVDHFNTLEKAIKYLKNVEKSTPLNGMRNGKPFQENSYEEWLMWLREMGYSQTPIGSFRVGPGYEDLNEPVDSFFQEKSPYLRISRACNSFLKKVKKN